MSNPKLLSYIFPEKSPIRIIWSARYRWKLLDWLQRTCDSDTPIYGEYVQRERSYFV
jgi:hypothetical protein